MLYTGKISQLEYMICRMMNMYKIQDMCNATIYEGQWKNELSILLLHQYTEAGFIDTLHTSNTFRHAYDNIHYLFISTHLQTY